MFNRLYVLLSTSQRKANVQITSNLMMPLSQARASALQSFASDAANNAALITSAAAVPQAIGTGFGYTIQDLRSIGNGEWAASAPMEAALIYFVCPLNCLRVKLMDRSSLLSTGLCSKRKEG